MTSLTSLLSTKVQKRFTDRSFAKSNSTIDLKTKEKLKLARMISLVVLFDFHSAMIHYNRVSGSSCSSTSGPNFGIPDAFHFQFQFTDQREFIQDQNPGMVRTRKISLYLVVLFSASDERLQLLCCWILLALPLLLPPWAFSQLLSFSFHLSSSFSTISI